MILTQEHLAGRLPATWVYVFCLDLEWGQVLAESTENPQAEGVTADRLACVMYTSGSTGRPKGICVVHRGVVRLVNGRIMSRCHPPRRSCSWRRCGSMRRRSKSGGRLLNGGRLAIMPPTTPSLKEIGQALCKYKVTTLWLTAGLFHVMVDQQIEDLLILRQLLAGGDVLSADHMRRLLDCGGNLTVVNGYGPTESTTFACCCPMTCADRVGASVSIGRPISNTRAYVLDRQLHLVPVGVEGELYLGGDGLREAI